MPTFMLGDKVILVDASITTSSVPIGSKGTIIKQHDDGNMYTVQFTNSHNELMKQMVFNFHIVKDVLEPTKSKHKHSNYDDLEVI